MAAAVLPERMNVWLGGPAFVTSTERRGSSTGSGIFLMNRARIRALARISSIRFCFCRKLAASASGGFFAGAI